MNSPKLSVIMSVYNDESYLDEAMTSILNQIYKDFEFIIVNDGSTDNSFHILKHYAKQDSRIILINQKNKGLTKSLNIAIKKSKGEYIARMDSDDISEPERLSKQISFLEKNSDYILVGTNVEKIDINSKHIEYNITKYEHENIYKTLKQRNCFAHGSLVINKRLASEDLIYDESFKYAQDYRLLTKLAKKGKLSNLREPLYKLRIHNKSISKKKVEEQSIYAGLTAYEFEINKTLDNYEIEIKKNKKLKTKIGKILLMNNKAKLAGKYFSVFSIYYYISIILQFIDISKLKRYFK